MSISVLTRALLTAAATTTLVVGLAPTIPAAMAAGPESAVRAAAPATAAPGKSARAVAAALPTASRGLIITTRTVGGYGRILVDGKGRPLYLFTRDRGTTSRCYGECARVWPVTLTRAKPRAGGAAVASKLGTTKRRDGRLQVTYAGRPLYYYVGDSPGVATCHNVSEFGGLWLLLRASGRRV